MSSTNNNQVNILPKRLEFKGWKQIGYYSIVSVPAIIYCVIQISNYTIQKVWFDFDLKLMLTLVTISILLAIYKYWRLGFKKYAIEHEYRQFQNAIEATGEELGWTYLSMDEEHFNGLLGSKHEITILRTNKHVYINTIDQVGLFSGILDLLKSRKNLHSFTRNLVSTVEGKDAVTIGRDKILSDVIAYNKQSEWTYKNIIKRVLGYMFAGFFMFLGYIGLSEKIYLLLIPGILAMVYIMLDVSVIIRKSRRKAPLKK